MAMKPFLKDHPSLFEVLRFIAQDNPEKEKVVKEELFAMYAQEIIETTGELRRQPSCEDYGIIQGMGRYRISHDEALKFIQALGMEDDDKQPSDKKTKKRGRPQSHTQTEQRIKTALLSFEGKRYSRPKLIELVAPIVGESVSTLDRWYKKCFPSKRKEAKKP